MKKKIVSLVLLVLSIFTFVGCRQQVPDVNVSVSDILEGIEEEIANDLKGAGVPQESFINGELPGFMEVDLTQEEQNPMAQFFNKENIEEGIVLQQMMNVKSDLIIVLKAKDETKVEDLKASLEKVKEGQVNTWSQYLPDQYEKVENNIIKSKDKYLIYITYNDSEKIETIFDDLLN